jgi:APA family basic amino acid/polyamine antiporter
MSFVRSIGRWGFIGLVINSIIGSGVFGTPGELIRLLGPASPAIVLIAGVSMALIMTVFIEVASQFSEPGGAYLYVRSAFGRFAGLQIGWFSVLAPLGAAAAQANLFLNYLFQLVPFATTGWGRQMIMLVLVAAPVAANYVGVRSGKNLSACLAIAKLVPLVLLIVIGLIHVGSGALPLVSVSSATPPFSAWSTAFMLAAFSFGGFEDSLVPAGEIRDPKHTIAFALPISALVCISVYGLIQFVAVAAVGTDPTDHPLSAVASVLIGTRASGFVAIAAMISTYGAISATVLAVPRLLFSLARHGDFPGFLARMNPRYQTPTPAIVAVGALILLLASTGTFLWALALCAGAMMVVYGSVCAALIELRRTRPSPSVIRVPMGIVLAIVGIAVSAFLLIQLPVSQICLMGLTSILATVNWAVAQRRPLLAA